MRILLTTHVFLPDYSAGTEVLTFNTAKELQRLGHEVEICTGYRAKPGLTDTQHFDNYEYEGIQVNRFIHNAESMGGQSNFVEAEYNNLFFASWFRGYLKYFKPDVVHFFHLGLISASAIDVCNNLNIPMVMTPTDFWLICPTTQLRLPNESMCTGPDRDGVNCLKHAVYRNQPSYLARIFNRLPYWIVVAMIWGTNQGVFSFSKYAPMVRALNRRSGFLKQRMNMLDRVVVPTRLMEQMLVNNGLTPDKVIFSRFGIHPLTARPKTHSEDALGKLRIGFIGSLSEHKGAHLLISAFHLLRENIALELKIYGRSDVDPKYFDKLKQIANSDSRIHFCGTFQNEDIGKIFSELDVLVVPSIWYENTPLVIYSAQAAGCPVIATNLGGMAEVIQHEINGLLFEVGDITGLADIINRLCQDRELLKQLASNAVMPKPIAGYVAELLEVYSEVLHTDKNKI